MRGSRNDKKDYVALWQAIRTDYGSHVCLTTTFTSQVADEQSGMKRIHKVRIILSPLEQRCPTDNQSIAKDPDESTDEDILRSCLPDLHLLAPELGLLPCIQDVRIHLPHLRR